MHALLFAIFSCLALERLSACLFCLQTKTNSSQLAARATVQLLFLTFISAYSLPWYADIVFHAVTWALSIMYGRVTLDESGKGAYMADVKLQPSEKWNMTSTGINCHHSIKNSARIMIATRWGIASIVSSFAYVPPGA